MPAVPSCILDPLRADFLALFPPHLHDHPLGCHRRRIDDAVVFGKLVEALVFGAGYERLADTSCSATTLRRRRDKWIRPGVEIRTLSKSHLPGQKGISAFPRLSETLSSSVDRG